MEDAEEVLTAATYRERRLAASLLKTSAECPYLSKVNRKCLDFDMEKVCSVTLSPHNVYVCLTCGLFFGGKGRTTPAYVHSVEFDHHVWVSVTPPEGISSEGEGAGCWRPRFWCLPDGYEVVDASLDDISVALRPKYSDEVLANLGTSPAMSLDASGTPFLPGYLGVNNLGHTDGVIALVQALAHISPLRDYFLSDPPPYASTRCLVTHRFGDLLRRLWSSRALRATVSPHAFVNAVSEVSNRRFTPGSPLDASEFLPWLLNTLHSSLVAGGAPPPPSAPPVPAVGGVKRPRNDKVVQLPPIPSLPSIIPGGGSGESIISHVFAGEVEVTLFSTSGPGENPTKRQQRGKNRDVGHVGGDEDEEEGGEEEERGEGGEEKDKKEKFVVETAAPKVSRLPFLFLTLDLPPVPLFTDARGGLSIPQVPVYELMNRFDGVTVTETLRGQSWERRKFRILRLPRVMALLFKRFSRNTFFAEKNPTIVTFPTRNLEMKNFVDPGALKRTQDAAAAFADAIAKRGDSSTMSANKEPPFLPPSPNELPQLSIASLKTLLGRLGAPLTGNQCAGLEKTGLVELAVDALARYTPPPQPRPRPNALHPLLAAAVTKYDLVASVVHDVASMISSTGEVGGGGRLNPNPANTTASANAVTAGGSPTSVFPQSTSRRNPGNSADPLHRGAYKVHLLGPTSGGEVQMGGGDAVGAELKNQWYEIADLRVTEILPQQVGVSETCLLLYVRRE